MFSPKPNVPYKLVFNEIQNNLVIESYMMITFTEENHIYPVESCLGFKPYEGYDKYNYRFVCYVCYMDNYIVLHSCISLKVLLNLEADTIESQIDSHDITKIYLEDELVFTI